MQTKVNMEEYDEDQNEGKWADFSLFTWEKIRIKYSYIHHNDRSRKHWIFSEYDIDDNEIESSFVTARPRRLSEVNIIKKTRPIPKGSAFFIFSNKNRYVICNETLLRDNMLSHFFRQIWVLRTVFPFLSWKGI